MESRRFISADNILSAPSLGNVCVLDIETAPDPFAIALAGSKEKSKDTTALLHHITDASVLCAHEKPDGTWTNFELKSFTAKGQSETDTLLGIDRYLTRLTSNAGTLVSYNGIKHDMQVVRRRAANHLMFEMPGIFPSVELRHLDLMRVIPTGTQQRWGKLRDVAAGLGIPVSYQTLSRGMGVATPGIRKSQVDVVATFLVMLYELATWRRDVGPVVLGWGALGKYISEMGPHGDHLAQYRRHPLGGGVERR